MDPFGIAERESGAGFALVIRLCRCVRGARQFELKEKQGLRR